MNYKCCKTHQDPQTQNTPEKIVALDVRWIWNYKK